MKLQARYTITVVGLIVAIVLILSSSQFIQFDSLAREMTRTGVDAMSSEMQDQIRRRGQTAASFLSKSLENSLYSYDMETMQSLLVASKQLPDIEAAYVYSSNMEIVHDGSEDVGMFGKSAGQVLSIADTWNPTDAGFLISNDLLISYQPIYIGEELLGGVALVMSMETMQQEILSMQDQLSEIAQTGLRNTTYMVILTTTLLIAVGLILSWPIAKSLIEPIRKLRYFADQVGKGNYDTNVKVQRDDELGELANAFEEMSINLRNTNDQIQHIAYHDELTQLPNRRLFRDYLEHELATCMRTGLNLALLFIDVDNFKRVNDTLGHDAGDVLLKDVAQRIASSIREEDYVGTRGIPSDNDQIARFGGDEFMALLPRIVDPVDAADVSRRIMDSLGKPFYICNNEVFVGASIGITIAPGDGTQVDTLIKNADLAMYQAKENGKNQYQFYSEDLNAAALTKFAIEADLRQAIEEEQFVLYYQPKVEITTGKVISAEALLRWNHPQKGWISPAGFIAVAENTGLIAPIGKWVIEQSCQQVAEWRAKGIKELSVAFNVSSVQFRSQQLPKILRENMAKHHLNNKDLQVEVTETALMDSETSVASQLRELREMGIYIWLDDFGTGYSSLGYLRKFPVNGVKIDRSFVMDIESSVDDQALVSAVVAMAKKLKLGVVAEGIETQGQLAYLRKQGCEFAQGYLYSRPMPAEEFVSLVQANFDVDLCQS